MVFYYHFLDMQTGRRAWQCELSTIDSTFLLAGALMAGMYFDADTAEEHEIRTLADALYRRADWQWAQNQGATVTHGWKPESGFLKYRWEGYDEALLLYMLGLGSPTHPLPESSYAAWASTYRWETCYGYEYLYSGPLFTHQLSHVWIDFRGIQDAFMRGKGIDYFENSRRATYVQQQYAIANPLKFVGYDRHCWGLTASDGPDSGTIKVGGWYHAGRFDDQRFDANGVPLAVSGAAPRRLSTSHAVYGIIDQQIYRLPGSDAGAGINVSGRITAAPSDRSLIDLYIDGGLKFSGFVPGRPDDTIGLGFAYARIGDGRMADKDAVTLGSTMPVRSYELVLEANYIAQIVPGWTIEPDLQYIVHPAGGISDPKSTDPAKAIPDATVVGVRTLIRY